jgi:hypothetical protein
MAGENSYYFPHPQWLNVYEIPLRSLSFPNLCLALYVKKSKKESCEHSGKFQRDLSFFTICCLALPALGVFCLVPQFDKSGC